MHWTDNDAQSNCYRTWCVNWSVQAMRMRSAVAGLSSWKDPLKPVSLRAADIASLIAKNTVTARISGDSPTACIYQ